MSASTSRIERSFDVVAMAHVLSRLARSPQAPWLHTEVARRMAERLSLIRQQPRQLMEWWPCLGGAGDLLAQAYPRARRTWVEPTPAWLAQAEAHKPGWWHAGHWARSAPQCVLEGEETKADAEGVQLIWANMMLHACVDPPALMARWRDLLATDGFVMFSSLGPDTLRSLRELYARQGWPAAHVDFVDMHDLGDMLVQAGFADPVMDQECLTLTWPNPQALRSELRQLGANLSSQRFAGLRTPRWRARLDAALQTLADAQGRLPLTFEVVYGHAFKAPPRAAVGPQTTVSLSDMRDMVRRARATKGA